MHKTGDIILDKIKEFKKIMSESQTERVTLITNHYRITGDVYECEECNKENFVNLTNASLCLINDSYSEECDRYTSTNYDWLHINLDKIVAFSFIK